MDFGTLRATLQDSPSVAAFESVLQLATRALHESPGEYKDTLEPYILGSLERWPGPTRALQTDRFLETPVVRLARALNLEYACMRWGEVREMLAGANLRHLEHVNLRSMEFEEADTYEALASWLHESFGPLRSLDLSGIWRAYHYESMEAHGSGPFQVMRKHVYERQGMTWELLEDPRFATLEELKINEEVLGCTPSLGPLRPQHRPSPVLEHVRALTITATRPDCFGADRAVGALDLSQSALRYDLPALRELRIESHDLAQYLRGLPAPVFARLERLGLHRTIRHDTFRQNGSWSESPDDEIEALPPWPVQGVEQLPPMPALRHLSVSGEELPGLWRALDAAVPRQLQSLEVSAPENRHRYGRVVWRPYFPITSAWLDFLEGRAVGELECLKLRVPATYGEDLTRLERALSRCHKVQVLALGKHGSTSMMLTCLRGAKMKLVELDMTGSEMSAPHLESLMCSPAAASIQRFTCVRDNHGLSQHPFSRLASAGALPALEELRVQGTLSLEAVASCSHWTNLHTLELSASSERYNTYSLSERSEEEQRSTNERILHRLEQLPNLMRLHIKTMSMQGVRVEVPNPERWRHLEVSLAKLPEDGPRPWSTRSAHRARLYAELGPRLGEPAGWG